MKYFLDTEFHEYTYNPKFGRSTDTIELISIGIINEKNQFFYAICKDFNVDAAWQNVWLKENVLIKIYFDLLQTGGISGDERNMWNFTKKDFKKLLSLYGMARAEIAYRILMYIYETDQSKDNWLGSTDQHYQLLHEYQPEDPKEKPKFYAYFADYDWVVFCWIFGRMIDLPHGFPMFCMDLKQMMVERGLSKEWKQKVCPDPEGVHNALIDAKWNKILYHEIMATED